MSFRPAHRLCFAALLACGGTGGGGARPPGQVATLVANTGSAAFSVGWDPPTEDGGAAVQGYTVTVSPDLRGSGAITATTALLRDATDGTSYTVSVVARNAAGSGPARTIEVTPHATPVTGKTALTVTGDDSPSGIYDPSLLVADGHAWLAFSSVNYHLDAQSHRVQDVSVRLARSGDGGATWTYVRTVAAPSADVTIADPAPGQPTCGAATCTGHWVYETSWLVDDAGAPAGERFKLFAHQYFLYPPNGMVPGKSATQYHLGAIVVWSAASPEQLGASPPRTALRWNLSPAAFFPGGQNVNDLPELASCLVVGEGSAVARDGTLDLVVTCPYGSGTPLPQRIVLLRSTDHARTFAHVATLLEPADASDLPGASFFTAPALLATLDPAPVLIVTPSFAGVYGGCAVIPFADAAAGTLYRKENGKPALIRYEPTAPSTMGGACTAARGLTSAGLLQSEVSGLDPADWPPEFRILGAEGIGSNP